VNRREHHRDHTLRGAGGEQSTRVQLDGGGPCAFAHSDQHTPVTDHEDVTALEIDWAAEPIAPDGMWNIGEQRVVTVDRLEVDRLAPAHGLGHRRLGRSRCLMG
jgi:hypothetical protein